MKKDTATAQEVRDAFLEKDANKAIERITKELDKQLDYTASMDILDRCMIALPDGHKELLSKYDRLRWIAKNAFKEGYLYATEVYYNDNEMSYVTLFEDGED